MRLETSSYYALGIPLFGALMALEAVIAWRKKARAFRLADDLGSLSCGMGQILAGLFIGPLMLALYAMGYGLRVFTMPVASVWTWVFAFLAVDLCYYFYHRAGHTIALFYAVHGVHHQSDGLNVAVALRQPYVSDLYAIFFYFPLPLLGVPESVFFAAVFLLSINQTTLHSRVFSRPSLGIFNTPALHALHHAKNSPYLGTNFGATLLIWDRIFGTYRAPVATIEPELGATEGYTTHDSVAAQWRGFAELYQRVVVARGFWARARVVVGAPSASPSRAARAPLSASVPRATAVYGLLQFAFTTSIAVLCLVRQADFSPTILAIASALILFAYSMQGRMFDGNLQGERIRIALMIVVGAALCVLAPLRIYGLTLLAWTALCAIAWRALMPVKFFLRVGAD